MNVRKFVVDLIEPLGGQWTDDEVEDEPYWEIQRGEFRAQANHVAKEVTGGCRVHTGVFVSHLPLQKIADRISGEPGFHSVRWWDIFGGTVACTGLPAELQSHVHQIVASIEKETIEPYIEQFRKNRPDQRHPEQFNHLVALAWVGDFDTLDDYLQTFRRGKRLNFMPTITLEMIDRAVVIAVERMP